MPNEVEGRRANSDRQRWRLLKQLEDWLETPMIVLGFVWLALMIVELARGLPGWAGTLSRTIWIIFIVDYLLRLVLAPKKRLYIKRNLLTAVALVLPALRALRLFRVLRVLRAGRGLTFVRVISSTNRGMRALRRTMQRRGVGYALTLTILVALAGAAGMYTFERETEGFESFGEALWWTAMLLASLGTTALPSTAEGRLLGFLLGLYGLAVFGYLTATLASFFIDRDAEDNKTALAGQKAIKALENEVRQLREALERREGG